MGGQRHRLHGQLRRHVLAAVLAPALIAGIAHAQVVLDGTLGAPSALAGPGYAIANTLGQQVGANLFHSFSQFNLVAGDIATFSGLAGTANIIGRVTGGSASSIDGTLKSTIAGANLWLINPRGIAFGPHARLDLQGSFHASTASYLKLGANGRFDAANPGASVLTIDAPVAFGFLGAPAPITLNRSELKVPLGATLSLVGGDITATGTAAARVRLEAPGGQVNLASFAAPGEAALVGGAIDTGPASTLGAISLINATVRSEDFSNTLIPGLITIRGGKLTIENTLISTAHALPAIGTDVNIAVTGDFSMTGGQVRTTSTGVGDAGDISIRAANVLIAGGAIIDTSAFKLVGGLVLGGGRAGHMTIEASGDVTLTGGSMLSSITVAGPGPGRGGDTRIIARNLTIDDNALIKTSTFGDHDAGNVSIAVQNLTLSSGGRIVATPEFDISTTPGSGAGGRIDVKATGAVSIAGTGSGLFARTASLGRGGSIMVSARDITISDGGRMNSGGEDPFNIGVGPSGSITLSATGSIRLQGGAAITTQTPTAEGGEVTIRVADTLALTDSKITTSVLNDSGNGGAINIDPVFVVLNSSSILAQAQNGNGGNITIVSEFLLVSPDSVINATSRGGGVSGTILITAPGTDVGTRLAALPSSYVDASSLLREACGARATGNSFTGVGRGGLPSAPGSAAFASYGFGTAQRTASESALLAFSHAPNLSVSVLLPCPG